MNPAWRAELQRLIGEAKKARELDELLDSLLTPAEYDEIAARWQISKELLKGTPQREVREKLKVSIATVSRGAREMNYGSGILHKLYRRLSSPKA